jgi:PIN domain nuclease of toxin-antitoxin system
LIYLDTHVVAWLYAGALELFPAAVTDRLEAEDELRISPVVRLELQYLFEIGRVSQPAVEVVDAVEAALGVQICHAPFPAVVREAEHHVWTRDPFDRLIAAQASLHDAALITKDETIHRNYREAVWGRE